MRCDLSQIAEVSDVLDHDSVFVPVNGKKCDNPGVSAIAALIRSDVYVLMPNEGSVIIYVPYDENIYNVHIAFLPGYRGKQAIDMLKKTFKWMFDNTTCMKIIGFEYMKNRPAIRFIGCLGVDREGILKNVNGKGDDMVVFGHSKP